MFIELELQEILFAPAERNRSPTRVPLPETLRSAGARVVPLTGFYKHLAPLEPERCLVAALSRAAQSADFLLRSHSQIRHQERINIGSLLKLFRRHLAPGGLMLFTTHGDFVARRIPTRDFDYGLTAEQINRIGAAYPETGYGFEDYPGEQDYGVSLTSPEWIRARVQEVGGLREVYFKERGWDDHQDVFAFVREN